MIKNSPEWLSAFNSLMIEQSALEFKLGVHDCATVALKVARLTKTINAPEWYDGLSAAQLIGRSSLARRAMETFGDPIPYGSCLMGDIALARQTDETKSQYILCVFDGTNFLAPDARGFQRVNIGDLIMGWSV